MSSFTERSKTFSCPDFSGVESKDEHDVKPEPDRSRRWREASLWWLLELNAVQLDLLKVSVETHTTILSSPDPPSVFKGSAVSGTNQRNGNNPGIIREADWEIEKFTYYRTGITECSLHVVSDVLMIISNWTKTLFWKLIPLSNTSPTLSAEENSEITVSWFSQSLFVLCQFKEQKSSHDTFQTLWLIYLQRNQHFSSMSTFNRKKPRAEKQTLKNFFSFLFIKILQHVVAHHGWLCYVTLRVRLRLNNIRFLLHFHTCTDVKEQKD